MRLPFLAVRTRSSEETQALGERVGRLVVPGEILLLTGDLGTGKTTFVQGVGRGLDVAEQPRSPSFVIMHTYDGRYPLLHVDLYRCTSPGEVRELGLEQMLEAPRVSVVEWGEKAAPVVADDYLEVEFAWDDASEDVRTISFRPYGRWRERMGELGASVRDWSTAGTGGGEGKAPSDGDSGPSPAGGEGG